MHSGKCHTKKLSQIIYYNLIIKSFTIHIQPAGLTQESSTISLDSQFHPSVS